MNAARRKELTRIIEVLRGERDALADVAQEENDALDALPDSLQESDRAGEMQRAAEMLEEAVSDLEGMLDELQGLATR